MPKLYPQLSSPTKASESANILVFTLAILKPTAHNFKDQIHMWKDKTEQQQQQQI